MHNTLGHLQIKPVLPDCGSCLIYFYTQEINGTNVVGVLKGTFYDTLDDEVVVLGAHLDTRPELFQGVNRDGSGLTALISLAQSLNSGMTF